MAVAERGTDQASITPRRVTNVANGFSYLSLTSFRNYREVSFETGLDKGLGAIVLTGRNGAGKTNLLEALSYLAPGSGLRQATIAEVEFRQPGNHLAGNHLTGNHPAASTHPEDFSRQGGIAWAIHGRYLCQGGEHALGTGRDPLAFAQSGRERRVSRLNGAAMRSQASFAEILTVLWLTPQMDRLFSEGTSSRRRFLDRLVYGLDPAHAARVASYEQAMRERARILRGEAPTASGTDMNAWLSGLESEMAAQAVAIAAARLDAAASLNAAMAEGIGPFPQAELAVAGSVEESLGTLSALQAEDLLRERLATSRGSDADSAITQWGTHRSDLVVTLSGRHLGGEPLRAGDCSTGEQKALLIAIILAEARLSTRRRGEPPVILLDEVAAHLDKPRREALFAELQALSAQCWLTGTERDIFQPLSGWAQFVTAGDGRLQNDA
ncbi:MAG: DNA replication/repair protein RecF [Proteobacteria bacterium]|nr:DNA replication/repair protein RecF [Pseudomonadota bacterium]